MDINGMNGINNNLAVTNGLPLGFAMGMAMNEQALDHYGRLTEYEKEKLIAKSKGVKSKAEMNLCLVSRSCHE